ncbi:MAG: hypothetical protein AB7Q37_18850 [Pyrinomonadaceae bacterium]
MKENTFVICNEVDRPWAGLVAMIVELRKSTATVEFITTETSMKRLEVSRDRMTYIEDFGIDLTFENGTVSAKKVGPSTAKYPNGSERSWQGIDGETVTLKPHIAALFGVNAPRTIKAVLIDVHEKKVSEVEIEPTLSNYYKLLRCDCITIGDRFSNGDVLFVDDNGLLSGPTKFFQFTMNGYQFAGNGLIVGNGVDEAGEESETDAKTKAEYLGVFFVDLDGVEKEARAGATI